MSLVKTPSFDAARRWLPDAAPAAGVAIIGFVEAASNGFSELPGRLAFVVVLVGAAAMFRKQPGLALAGLWVAAAMQMWGHFPLMWAQVAAVMVVAFGTARFGSTAVVWLSALSIPAVMFAASTYAFGLLGLARAAYYATQGAPGSPPSVNGYDLGGFAVGSLALIVPWLLGLTLRFIARSESSTQAAKEAQAEAEERQRLAQSERAQAQEIAELREGQARLARDVHDVVGHSLAVILAQAESAAYLPDADTAKMREVLDNVAGSARQSLREVRDVLASTDGQSGVPGTTRTSTTDLGLDRLIEGVRAAGNDVRSSLVGQPQPLPPELATVAFRVMQEMLTNALKHGRRGEPVQVEQHWEGELRIEVANLCADLSETRPISSADPDPSGADAGAGQGVDGMRRRLESVGGRLDVRRRETDAGTTFTSTAWIPLRPVS